MVAGLALLAVAALIVGIVIGIGYSVRVARRSKGGLTPRRRAEMLWGLVGAVLVIASLVNVLKYRAAAGR